MTSIEFYVFTNTYITKHKLRTEIKYITCIQTYITNCLANNEMYFIFFIQKIESKEVKNLSIFVWIAYTSIVEANSIPSHSMKKIHTKININNDNHQIHIN